MPPPDRVVDAAADLRNGYAAAVTLYMQENSVTWARFNSMVSGNAFIFAAIGVSLNGRLFVLGLLLPVFGLMLCHVWSAMMRRGFDYMDHWRSQALSLEKSFAEHLVGTIRQAQDLRDDNRATLFGAPANARTFAKSAIWIFRGAYATALLQAVLFAYPNWNAQHGWAGLAPGTSSPAAGASASGR